MNRALCLLLARYCIIGCSGVALDLAFFYTLSGVLNVYYLTANMISVSIGIINNFIWNRKLNYKVNDKPLKRFFTFYSVGMLGLCMSTALLYIFVDVFGVERFSAKCITIVVVTGIQFTLNTQVTFRKKNAHG